MKKYFTFIFLLSAIALLVSCASPSSASSSVEYHKISAEDAKTRMDSGDDIRIVDVRTEAEYETAHIEGAILIPNETISDTQPELLPDLDAEILIYCRSGNRSSQAAKKLIKMGYTKINDFGGIIDWPYDTVLGPAEIAD